MPNRLALLGRNHGKENLMGTRTHYGRNMANAMRRLSCLAKLVVPQGDCGIDVGGAPAGDEASQHGDTDHREGDDSECSGICRLDAEEHAGDKASKPQCSAYAGRDSDKR